MTFVCVWERNVFDQNILIIYDFGKKMKIYVVIIVIKNCIIAAKDEFQSILYVIMMFWKIDVNVMNLPI